MGHEEEYEDDWKAEAPFLADLDKNVESDVPEGYFEDLPNAVLARIKAMSIEEAPAVATVSPVSAPAKGRVIGFRSSIFWSVAAGIVLLLTVGTYFLTRTAEVDDPVYASVEDETRALLAGLETDAVMEDLNPSSLNDEQLFAMLGKDGSAAFEDQDHEVRRDDAYEYLQDVDLDAIDLQGMDIDLNDID